MRLGTLILPTCFGLKKFPFLKNNFNYQQTVLDMLKNDKQLSAENLLVVKQKMKWAVEPIRQDKSLSKADADERIFKCWQSLHEIVLHDASWCYGKDVGSMPYYQALKYTNMRINDVLGEILGLVYPKYPLSEGPPGILGPFDEAEAKKALSNLNKNGYHIMSKRLKPELIAQIQGSLSNLTYKNHPKFDPTVRDGSVNFVEDQRETIEKVPMSIDLMLDPTIMHIVQDYLGASPVNMQVNTWWSVAGGGASITQMWHQDFTWVKFIKIFVYVNNVFKANGAHRYIPGSFKDISHVLELKHGDYEVSNRVSEEEIQKLYPGKETYMEGPAGTILLEDTRGFHAGVPLKEGYRQLMQWEFAISNYRYDWNEWAVTRICQSSLKAGQLEGLKKYPRIFERLKVNRNC